MYSGNTHTTEVYKTNLFLHLPNPPDTFMHELSIYFLKFLWDGKINKTVVCKAYEDGGINTLNVFGFLSGMKIIGCKKSAQVSLA